MSCPVSLDIVTTPRGLCGVLSKFARILPYQGRGHIINLQIVEKRCEGKKTDQRVIADLSRLVGSVAVSVGHSLCQSARQLSERPEHVLPDVDAGPPKLRDQQVVA